MSASPTPIGMSCPCVTQPAPDEMPASFEPAAKRGRAPLVCVLPQAAPLPVPVVLDPSRVTFRIPPDLVLHPRSQCASRPDAGRAPPSH